MAQNLVTKYSPMIDERFAAASITEAAINKDFDFVGAKTVKVFSASTVAMSDYARSGSARYGTPGELDNSVQEMTMGKDRAFTFTVDKANDEESGGSLNAGKALRRQQDEVITPEIDKYRLTRMTAGAGHVELGAYTGDTKPYERILNAQQYLDERSVPRPGRICYVTGAFRTKLRLDSNFVEANKIDPATRINGQIGSVDEVPIIAVPLNYLPTGVEMLLVHPQATTAPQKLAEFKTHIDPPGINGTLCEGRVYYDAFVLGQKVNALYALRTALKTIALSCAAGVDNTHTVATVSGYKYDDGTNIGTLVYKTGASQAAPALGDDISSGWTELTLASGAATLAVTATHKLVVACRDAAGKAVASSAAVTVAVGGT
jgi:N4-gp56 family major capsid protein